MTAHENQLSKHTINMQEHVMIGLHKALEEKEKVRGIINEKIHKYTFDNMEYVQEKEKLFNELFH
jgi:hypothetical protein